MSMSAKALVVEMRCFFFSKAQAHYSVTCPPWLEVALGLIADWWSSA